MKNNRYDGHYQYSKKIPIITGIIFIFCIIIGVCTNSSSSYDMTIFVTAISTSGGIFGASIIWYLKKSQAENAFKLKKELYRTAASVRYSYTKRILELQKEMGVTKEQIYEVESESPLDEMEQEALSRLENTVNEHEDDAHSYVDLQQF